MPGCTISQVEVDRLLRHGILDASGARQFLRRNRSATEKPTRQLVALCRKILRSPANLERLQAHAGATDSAMP